MRIWLAQLTFWKVQTQIMFVSSLRLGTEASLLIFVSHKLGLSSTKNNHKRVLENLLQKNQYSLQNLQAQKLLFLKNLIIN